MGPSIETRNSAAAVMSAGQGSAGRRWRRARRRRLRRSIIAAGVVCVLPGAWAMAVRSPLVRARMIDVAGAAHLTRSQALDLARISPSTNVASLDAAAVVSRLEANPWVAHATVEKRLPWTIRIELVERTPVLVVKDGPTDRILAGDGTLLGKAAPEARALPLLRVAPREADPMAIDTTLDRAASALAPIAPWARDAIREVSLARDGSLAFRLAAGGTILYGDDANSIAKARTFVALLRWSKSEGEEIISADLRIPGAPTARLRSGGGGSMSP